MSKGASDAQVELMTRTHLLISVLGAGNINAVFMPR
jgi:hypothetical protein